MFLEHRRMGKGQQVIADLVARQRGSETIRREDIWELREEVGDALRSGGQGWSSRGKVDLWRTRRENPLDGYVKEKSVVVEQIRPKDG